MILPSGISTSDYSRLANAKGWGSGWPACGGMSGNIVQVRLAKSGTLIAGGVHKNIAELFGLIGNEIERRGYLFRPGWCWGAECRAISGSNTPSNHSWGLAVDINAPNNPYTSTGQHDIPDWAFALLRSYGFGLGADYSGKKDWMHAEFLGNQSDATIMTSLARKNLGGGGVVTPDPPTTPEDDSMSAEELNTLIAKIDGVQKQVSGLQNLLFLAQNQGGGHDIQAEVQYATKAQVLPAVQDVLNRILPPGGRWDNFQDIINRVNEVLKGLNIPVPESPVPATPEAPTTYTVQPGDTLGGIAKATGHSVAELQQWNNIADPNSINVGQVIKLTP